MAEREITVSEFRELYADGLLFEVVYLGGTTKRAYGRSTKGQSGNPLGFEVVYCKL